jgi:hypothetical protein
LAGLLAGVSRHCESLLSTVSGSAQVLGSPTADGNCGLVLDYLSLLRRLVAAFIVAHRAGYVVR